MTTTTLRRAEEQVAEARHLVLQQKGLIIRIRAAGIDTSNAERTLKVLERNLKTFEKHRDALKRRHADIGPSAADETDSAGSG
jgi:F420-0:gamma-glutamyl ligase